MNVYERQKIRPEGSWKNILDMLNFPKVYHNRFKLFSHRLVKTACECKKKIYVQYEMSELGSTVQIIHCKFERKFCRCLK